MNPHLNTPDMIMGHIIPLREHQTGVHTFVPINTPDIAKTKYTFILLNTTDIIKGDTYFYLPLNTPDRRQKTHLSTQA